MNDNATPMRAKEYDKKIKNTIPYYDEFYTQTLDIVETMNFQSIKWLDLGCGTGTLENKAIEIFPNAQFVMADPSEKMLEQAKAKNPQINAQYICKSSSEIAYDNEFNVATAIQSHHYMRQEERTAATKKVYQALQKGGIYITFENTVPSSAKTKEFELQRWGKYQFRHGKSEEEVKIHLSRCGTNYFPLTINQHIDLLDSVGFQTIHLFWFSYMQMGLYAIK